MTKFWTAACYLALGGVAALPVQADVVLSSMTDPGIDIEAEAPERVDNLAGLLGQSAPEVRTHRRAHLSKMLGRDRADTIPAVSYDYAWVDAQPEPTGDTEWRCLSEALYFEARGEEAEGVFAVAEVILNRAESTRYPDSVCGVINQGAGVLHKCQFSYNCDGIPEVIHEAEAYERVGKIARAMLDGARRELTDGALFYHTVAIYPYWASSFDRTVTIGHHHFYARS